MSFYDRLLQVTSVYVTLGQVLSDNSFFRLYHLRSCYVRLVQVMSCKVR